MIPPSLPTPPASTTESVIGCEEVSSHCTLLSSSGSPAALNTSSSSDAAIDTFDIFESLASSANNDDSGVSQSLNEAAPPDAGEIDTTDDVTALLLDEVRNAYTVVTHRLGRCFVDSDIHFSH